MPQIQPGHEVLSLFGIAAKLPVLNKKTIDHSLIVSLLSAFFIVLVAGIVLSVVTKNLMAKSQSAGTATTIEEKAAFLPGRLVSNEISRGYLGNYR